MYRFRSIGSLLDNYQELEKQEIYFAPPSELNDPVEGFMDLYWQGDRIVWENLLKNYIRSVENFMFQILRYGETKKINEKDIRLAFYDPKVYPHNSPITNAIIDKIFTFSFVNRSADLLAERTDPIRRQELISYLKQFHLFVIDIIGANVTKRTGHQNLFAHPNLAEYNEKLQDPKHVLEQEIDWRLKGNRSPDDAEKLFTMLNEMENNANYKKANQKFFKLIESNSFFLISNFSEAYVNKLESLVYHNWYCASFLEECHNSSVWGHYGDQHRGVCLKFRTPLQKGIESLKLRTEYGIDGAGNPQFDMVPHPFMPVNYSNKTISVDFFRSIGTLPVWYLRSAWYKDNAGNISKLGAHLDIERDEWLDERRKQFEQRVSTKLDDWNYEKEHRLVLNDIVYQYENASSRKLTYDFNDLEGIIFGIKTTYVNKLRIAKIIGEKCKLYNRPYFDFYQAYYASETGKIEIKKIARPS